MSFDVLHNRLCKLLSNCTEICERLEVANIHGDSFGSRSLEAVAAIGELLYRFNAEKGNVDALPVLRDCKTYRRKPSPRRFASGSLKLGACHVCKSLYCPHPPSPPSTSSGQASPILGEGEKNRSKSLSQYLSITQISLKPAVLGSKTRILSNP